MLVFTCFFILVWHAAARLVKQTTLDQSNPLTGSLEFSTPASRLGYMTASGYASLNVTVKSINKVSSRSVTCSFFGLPQAVCLVWSSEDSDFDATELLTVRVGYRRYDQRSFDFSLFAGDFVDVSANQKAQLALNGLASLNLLVDFKDFDISHLDVRKTRLQFIALLPYGNQMDSVHGLTMYLRKGTARPTANNSIIQDFSRMGFGIVRTLASTDPDFCLEASCKIAVRLETVNVAYLDFFIQTRMNDVNLSLAEGNTFIDDLQAGDQVTYQFQTTSPSETSNWKFYLLPLFGNPDMAVDFGIKPKTWNDYRWKTTEDQAESIYITKAEVKDLDLNTSNFFVTFKTASRSQFVFRVFTNAGSWGTHLRPNVPVSGQAKAGEIVNYMFKAHSTYPETISVFLRLAAKSGNPDLFIKDCSMVANYDCFINQADIEDWSDLAADKDRLALSSTQTDGDDGLYFRFNCLPPGDQFANFTFDGDEANLFTTTDCMFAVAVLGNSSSTHSTSSYTLELKGAKRHELLEVRQSAVISTLPKVSKCFKLPLVKVNAKQRFLNFKLIVNSGDFSLHYSRTAPFPDAISAFRSFEVASFAGQKTGQFEHIFTIEADGVDLNGDHFICIEPSSYTLASILPFTSIHNAETEGGDNYQELVLGQTIFDSLTAVSKSSKSYFISLDVPEERSKDVEVTVQLKATKGNLRFCVSASKTRIDSEEDCTWKDKDGLIVISSSDSRFKRTFDYGVLVQPVATGKNESDAYYYSLMATSQEQFSNLIIGLSTSTGSFSSPQAFFRVDVDRDADFLGVLVTSDDSYAQVIVSNDVKDLSRFNHSEFFRLGQGVKASVLYKREALTSLCSVYEKHHRESPNLCPLFIKIVPSRPAMYSYDILVVATDRPIYLTEGQTLSIPAPGRSPLSVIYYPTASARKAVINAYHPYQHISMAANFKAFDKIKGDLLSDKTFLSTDFPTSVIYIPEALFNASRANSVEISFRHPLASNNDLPVDMNALIQVQINSGITAVSDSTPVFQGQGKKGMFDYYIYTKPLKSQAFIYLRVLAGEADLYVRRSDGSSLKLPDLDTFDYRSVSEKNDELMLPVSKVMGGNEDETFVIGIYNFVASSYQLQTGIDPKFTFLRITPGTVVKRSVDPERPLLLSMLNADAQPFRLSLMAERSQVVCFYQANDENKIGDFHDMVPSMTGNDRVETDAGLIIVKQDLRPAQVNKLLWTFVIKPLQVDTVTFVIEKGRTPLQLPLGDTFNDLLASNECQIYEIQYNTDVFDERVRISLQQGEIKVFGSGENLREPTANWGSVTLKSEGSMVSKTMSLKTVVGGADNNTKTSDVFNKAFLQVCSMSPLAVFSLKAFKPSVRFERLTPNERLTIDAWQNRQTYYYRVTPAVKSIKVRAILTPRLNRSDLIDAAEDVAAALKFYYVNDDFGSMMTDFSTIADPSTLIMADIKKTTVDDGRQMVIEVGVQQGYLLMRVEQSQQTSKKILRLQFIVNDYHLLPLSGLAFEHIRPGITHTFQITKPMKGITDLTMSACQGEVKVTIIDQENSKTIDSFMLGNNATNLQKTLHSDLKDLDFELSKPISRSIKSQSSVILVNLTSLSSTEASEVTFKTETKMDEAMPSLFDYFQVYSSSVQHPIDPVVRTIEADGRKSLVVKAIRPAEGFEERYRSFVRAEIVYTVQIFTVLNFNTTFALNHMCRMEKTNSESAVFFFQVTRKIAAVNGQLIWQEDPTIIDLDFKSPAGSRLEGSLQMAINFFGDDDQADDDDTVVLLKHLFKLPDAGLSIDVSKRAVGGALVLTIMIGAIICGVVFWINKHKLASPDTRGFQRPGGESEMNQLRLDAVDDGHRTETADRTAKVDMDETV